MNNYNREELRAEAARRLVRAEFRTCTPGPFTHVLFYDDQKQIGQYWPSTGKVKVIGLGECWVRAWDPALVCVVSRVMTVDRGPKPPPHFTLVDYGKPDDGGDWAAQKKNGKSIRKTVEAKETIIMVIGDILSRGGSPAIAKLEAAAVAMADAIEILKGNK